MMTNNISKFLSAVTDNLKIVNKLLVQTYVEFNNIQVHNNELILSYLKGNDKDLVSTFLDLIQQEKDNFTFEDLIVLFETTIPTSEVITNGAVYTPHYIKEYIIEESIRNQSNNVLSSLKVADISCGSGAFLYTAAQKIQNKTGKSFNEIFKENIFGLDISESAIERTKILLSLLALTKGEDVKCFNFNLIVGNALSFDWHHYISQFDGFDIIIGNPPYVRARNLSDETKSLLIDWEVTKTGNTDLYIPFFEIGFKYLKDSGILGYITVNTFKRSVNARQLRNFFKRNFVKLKIVDFGSSQVFKNKSTYTCIVFLEKNKCDYIEYIKTTAQKFINNKPDHFYSINYHLLDNHDGWILNDPEILETLVKIENTGIPLGDMFVIRNGLATLSNNIFIFKPASEDSNYYYIDSVKLEKIEKNICREVIKPNKLRLDSDIESLKEQIIFPYHDELLMKSKQSKKVSVFDEVFFKQNYPEAYKYLQSYKEQLLERDKGENQKYKWYEFGRNQALTFVGKKLFFPYITNDPCFIYSDDDDLLFYAGYAILSDSERELNVLKRILESSIFWYYIKKTSKPYSGDYFSLAKNYIKNFGVCILSEEEKDILLKIDSHQQRDLFLLKKYELNIECIL